MSLEEVCVKQECDSDGCGDNEVALAALYEDHVVKQELVLGPELLQPRDAYFALQGPVKKEEEEVPQAELHSDANMLERIPDNTAHCNCSSKTDTLIGETESKCNKCIKGYNLHSGDVHVVSNYSENEGTSKDFTCDLCDIKYYSKLLLLQHGKSQHGVQYFTCDHDTCEFATKRAKYLRTHLRTHTEEKPFKCSQCSSTFTRSDTLRTHLRTHTGEKPYKCSQCDSAFTRSDRLRSHILTHTREEKPYKCSQCSSTFTRSCDLQRHLRTHTGEKPFKCGKCSAAFSQNANLQCHLRIHTGEKPYKCSQCSSAFTTNGDLQRHLRTHTGEKPFKCNICDYKTIQPGNLQSHLKSRHSGQKPFNCDVCSFRSATRGHLRLHMKRSHKSHWYI